MIEEAENICWKILRWVISESKNRYGMVIYGTVIVKSYSVIVIFLNNHIQFGYEFSKESLLSTNLTPNQLAESVFSRNLESDCRNRDRR